MCHCLGSDAQSGTFAIALGKLLLKLVPQLCDYNPDPTGLAAHTDGFSDRSVARDRSPGFV